MRSFARRHRVLVVVLAVAGLLSLGVGAVGVLAYCDFVGCTLGSEEFEPNGDEARTARAAATAEVAALADRVVAGHEVLADGTVDGCIRGFNDWKRKDTYSHECSVADSRLVLVTSEHDAVAGGLTAADAGLRAAGCRPVTPRSGLERVRDEYWSEANPQVRQRGAAGLPGGSYSCPGGVTVEVQPTSSEESVGTMAPASDPVFLDDVLHEDWYTPADVTTLRGSGAALALVVTARSTYYRTRF